MTASPATVRAASQQLGVAAPPMIDGEPVFAEPWEGRAYGLALELVERRGLPWDAFRDRLIVAIADAPDRPYYESWVVALEGLAASEQLVSDDDLTHERAEVGAYRYDEAGRDIEVIPLAHDHGTLALAFGDEMIDANSAHVEMYRVWHHDDVVATGVRTFDQAGEPLTDRSIELTAWERTRDRLLSFGERSG
jgi:nitrile hydratase accessory protein